MTLIYLLPLILILMYFMMIRPAQNQKRRQAEMTAKLGPGAEVRTIGGVLGTVVEADDESVTVETTPGTRLRFVRAAIAGVISGADEEAEEAVPGVDADSDVDTTAEDAVAETSDEADASESTDEGAPELAADKR